MRWIEEKIYIRRLESPLLAEREAAATRLGEIKSTRAIAKLVSLLLKEKRYPARNPETGRDYPEVKDQYAVKALLAIGRPVPAQVTRYLDERDWETSIRAEVVLEMLGSEAVEPLLEASRDEWQGRRALNLLKPFVNTHPKVFDRFVAQLNCPEEWRRYSAVEALPLARTRAQEAVPLLRARLEDPKETPTLRYAAAFEMLRLGEVAVSALKATLAHPDVLVGVYAARALHESGRRIEDECLVALRSGLQATDARARSLAVLTLGELRQITRESLMPFLNDPEIEVRSAAIRALEKTGVTPEFLPPLMRIFNEDGNDLAAYLVGRLGPAANDAVPELITALTHDDGRPRRIVIHALGRIGAAAKSAVPALTKILATESPDAAKALGRIGPGAREAVPALIAATLSDDCKNEAIEALRRIGPEALAIILRGLRQERATPEGVRTQTVEALAAFGPAAKEALPTLIELAQGEDSDLAKCAVRPVGRMGSEAKETVPLLSSMLAAVIAENSGLGPELAEALGRIGPEAKPATAILLKAVLESESDDVGVRAHAILALGRIRAEGDAVLIALRKALRDQEDIVRTLAALALVHLDAVDAEVKGNLKVVHYSASHGEEFVSILEGYPEETLALMPALIRVLQDKSNPVTACRLLDHLGARAAPAAAALEGLIQEFFSNPYPILPDLLIDTAEDVLQKIKSN